MSATQAPSTAIPRRVIGALTLGLIALAVFTIRAWHQAQLIIDMRLFTDSRFSLHVGAYILFEISALALSFILPNHLQLVDGCTSLQAGLVVLPGAVSCSHRQQPGGHHRCSRPVCSRRPTAGHYQRLPACTEPAAAHRCPGGSADPGRPASL